MNINLETKDIVTLTGITATLVLSIWSLIVNRKNTKKTLFINTVTNSRIRFIDNFRNNVAEYCGTVLHLLITEVDEHEERILYEKLDRVTYLIKLQLNRHDVYDLELIEKLQKIDKMLDYESTNKKDQQRFEDQVTKELDDLVQLSQDFLKLEWEGVKHESINGNLSKTRKTSMVKKYLGNL